MERLKYMTYYCTTSDCLRGFILKYFGDRSANYCGKCSNCLTQFETVDITVDAQKILSCIIKTGQRFGKKMICDILRGSKSERIMRLGLDSQSTYGIMKSCNEKRLREIIDYLEQQGYIAAEGGEYPVLKVTAASYGILRGNVSLSMKAAKAKAEEPHKPVNNAVNAELLEALKELRRKLAAKKRVPAYVIFSDASLTDMCKKLPKTPEEFLNVSGVGNVKLAQYGEQFLEVIRRFKP